MTEHDDIEEMLSRVRPVGPPASMQLPPTGSGPLRERRPWRRWLIPAVGLALVGGATATWWHHARTSESAQLGFAPAVAAHDPREIFGLAARSRSARPIPEEILRIGGDVKEPFRIQSVAPLYTVKPAPGVVAILQVTVDAQGVVQDVQVLRGRGRPAAEAASAVRQWRYEPLLVDGEARWFVITVVISSP